MNLILSIVLLALCSRYSYVSGLPGIAGGEKAHITKAPYQAALSFEGKFICGAVIFKPQWLITAAHCVAGRDPDLKDFQVFTGLTYFKYYDKNVQNHSVARLLPREDYNEYTSKNDIALIQLVKPIEFDVYQRPIPIYEGMPAVGQVVKISGYGKEAFDGKASKHLKIAKVKMVGKRECKRDYYSDEISDDMFCAAAQNTDACQGDSGGPAVYDNKLLGITSFGEGCADKNHPGVYQWVYKHKDWIYKTIGKYISKQPILFHINSKDCSGFKKSVQKLQNQMDNLQSNEYHGNHHQAKFIDKCVSAKNSTVRVIFYVHSEYKDYLIKGIIAIQDDLDKK